MGQALVWSAALHGLAALPVGVEVDISSGMPAFTIVGLPDAAIQESKERVRSAIKRSGLPFPRTRITVNLSPADVKKHGPVFDFAIALALLAADGTLMNAERLTDCLCVGELALDGTLRPVRGALLASIMARRKGLSSIMLPPANAREASLVDGIVVHPVLSLPELIHALENEDELPVTPYHVPELVPLVGAEDMENVRGQENVKRALEVAAAGGHNVLLSGPPGSGKTMIARALPSILPSLTLDEALELTAIHSVAGLLQSSDGVVGSRPFRAPHHTASGTALIGGGAIPKPGEISLAHRGVLFLDEFPEFSRSTIENLRQPLEDGVVSVSRASGTFTFPARFMLVAAMNPCPCGFVNDPEKTCSCTPGQIAKYQQRLSGPLLDRIDVAVDVPRVPFEKLATDALSESSVHIRERVQYARDVQTARYKNDAIATNAELSAKLIRTHCTVDDASRDLLRGAVERLGLSARAYSRVLKIARSIADLAHEERICKEHIAEAIQFRPKNLTSQ